jgi:hypothetical protein
VIAKKLVSGVGENAKWTTVWRGKTGTNGKAKLSVKGIPAPVSTWTADGTNYPPFSHVVIVQKSSVDFPVPRFPVK